MTTSTDADIAAAFLAACDEYGDDKSTEFLIHIVADREGVTYDRVISALAAIAKRLHDCLTVLYTTEIETYDELLSDELRKFDEKLDREFPSPREPVVHETEAYVVEAIDADGGIECTIFSGPDAHERAKSHFVRYENEGDQSKTISLHQRLATLNRAEADAAMGDSKPTIKELIEWHEDAAAAYEFADGKFKHPDDVGRARMHRATARLLSAMAIPSPSATEDEAIKAALAAFRARWGEYGDLDGAIVDAIIAADLARFGGDPGEIISALKSEREIVAGGDMILVSRQAANQHRQLNRDLSQKVDDQAARIAALEAQLTAKDERFEADKVYLRARIAALEESARAALQNGSEK